MSYVRVAQCDVCKKIKGEANKWILVFVTTDRFAIFYNWFDPPEDIAHEYKMFCSEQCLFKLENEFLRRRCVEEDRIAQQGS